MAGMKKPDAACCRLHNLAPFSRVERQWLLAKHVFAGLERRDGLRRMQRRRHAKVH